MSDVPAITVNKVSKQFDNVEVLRDINLTVNKGEVVSILGSSGSGKSTLLRCMNWLEQPDRGAIYIGTERIGIDDHTQQPMANKQLAQLRQRVGMARALVREPAILLMDEPFSALDVLTAENLRTDILQLWSEGKTATKSIVMVTHGIEEAVYMANRAIILGAKPAQIREELAIDLPYLRNRESGEFKDLVQHIYGQMMTPAE